MAVKMRSIIISISLLLSLVSSQSLLDATSSYPQLTSFRSLLLSNPTLIPDYNSSQKVTILIPSNAAFTNYLNSSGSSIDSLPSTTLKSITQYHTLNGAYRSTDLNSMSGLLADSLLKDDVYNHRNSSAGQVVFINRGGSAGTDGNGAGLRLTVRQANAGTVSNVTSGEGNVVQMDAVDGIWSGGTFQIVDGWVITVFLHFLANYTTHHLLLYPVEYRLTIDHDGAYTDSLHSPKPALPPCLTKSPPLALWKPRSSAPT